MSQIQANRSLAFRSKSKLDEKKSGAFFRVLKRAGRRYPCHAKGQALVLV